MKIFDFFKRKKKENKENIQIEENYVLPENKETKIRMSYVGLEVFYRYGTNELKIGETYGIGKPFKIPEDMTIEDACKVISYLSEKVEEDYDLEPASESSVKKVIELLPVYGFEKIDEYQAGHKHIVSKYTPTKIKTAIQKCEGVVDLFTVGGQFDTFKNSDLYDRYFDWFTEGVSKQEVLALYRKIGKDHLIKTNQNTHNEKNTMVADKGKEY